MYSAIAVEYDKERGTINATKNNRATVVTDIRVLKQNKNDLIPFVVGSKILCLEENGISYMLGYYTSPEDVVLENIELEGGGRVISASEGSCIYLSSGGEIGIYKTNVQPNRSIGFSKVFEYSLDDDRLSLMSTVLDIIFPWGSATQPNFSVKPDVLGNVQYVFQGKTSVNDMSPRFVITLSNPTVSGKGILNIKVDKLFIPLRVVPMLPPTPVESIEINIGANITNKIFEIKIAPLTTITIDIMGNIDIKTGVSTINISPIGAIAIKSGASKVEMNVTGVITISGTLLKINPAVLGASPGWCSIPVCPLSGLPHITHTAPLLPI